MVGIARAAGLATGTLCVESKQELRAAPYEPAKTVVAASLL